MQLLFLIASPSCLFDLPQYSCVRVLLKWLSRPVNRIRWRLRRAGKQEQKLHIKILRALYLYNMVFHQTCYLLSIKNTEIQLLQKFTHCIYPNHLILWFFITFFRSLKKKKKYTKFYHNPEKSMHKNSYIHTMYIPILHLEFTVA